MPFCEKCGGAVSEGASFCGSCGASVGAVARAATPQAAPEGGRVRAGMASNVAGLLTYIPGFVVPIIFLSNQPYRSNKFVRFHAFQSLFFDLVLIGFGVIWVSFWGLLLSSSSGSLRKLGDVLDIILGWGIGGYLIFLMYKAYNNERYAIPFIGNLAAKRAG